MRLFGKVTGYVDTLDRAEWLTPPFDRCFVLIPKEREILDVFISRQASIIAGISRSGSFVVKLLRDIVTEVER